MAATKIGFTRWYDNIPELAQAVRLLERVPENVSSIICESVVNSHEYNGEDNTSEDYGLKKLGAQKVLGLMKSKTKRRWYDQHPVIHRAFNTLYMMDDTLRYETAIRILVALEALKQHDLKLSGKEFTVQRPPELNQKELSEEEHQQMVREIVTRSQRKLVQNIFLQPTGSLLNKIQFVQQQKDKQDPQPPAKTAEMTETTIASSDRIIESNEGLKLDGLSFETIRSDSLKNNNLHHLL
ncbi:MAG: hypothetical protein VKJ04_07040 [Vampirovibrionales bacterium]|nr:hypothetical protein [Vampirovibrionales bacterium]